MIKIESSLYIYWASYYNSILCTQCSYKTCLDVVWYDCSENLSNSSWFQSKTMMRVETSRQALKLFQDAFLDKIGVKYGKYFNKILKDVDTFRFRLYRQFCECRQPLTTKSARTKYPFQWFRCAWLSWEQFYGWRNIRPHVFPLPLKI